MSERDRLTRNVEAREKARQEKNAWKRRAKAAEAKIDAVRELHIEQLSRSLDGDGNPDTYCEACGVGPYPCPTVKALGEQ